MPIFAIYKPRGPSSSDIVQKIKRITGARKVGHAGTLDPLAKGILVIGVGREATKKLNEIIKKEKEYLATIKLGWASATDDEEGNKTKVYSPRRTRPTKKEIEEIIKKFKGEISQTPPIFSAVKVKGKEAYKLARRGKTVQLNPRRVEIKNIKILKYQWPYLKIKVTTGPGVYIRSLSRDIGQKLGTGAYLYSLERTRVGNFAKRNVKTLNEVRRVFELGE